ncbi:hypothetical protein CDD81_2445 [Ophiocordyceps australis]|uniref:Uncharacterized protein n=1 Tax=Ophiocordyceps australis TaxID=1399860 RepID=A0A2C5XEN2_9HYPO|nr:hypothetical protein CDD81_2445 [Ophiocordyceps australis]
MKFTAVALAAFAGVSAAQPAPSGRGVVVPIERFVSGWANQNIKMDCNKMDGDILRCTSARSSSLFEEICYDRWYPEQGETEASKLPEEKKKEQIKSCKEFLSQKANVDNFPGPRDMKKVCADNGLKCHMCTVIFPLTDIPTGSQKRYFECSGEPLSETSTPADQPQPKAPEPSESDDRVYFPQAR